MPTWLTGSEAVKHLKVSRSTFYRLVREGKIKPYTLPGLADPRYKLEEIDALFTAQFILLPGFTSKISETHAVVYTPYVDQPAWSLLVATVGIGRAPGQWVPEFRFDSDPDTTPEEQLAAAKQAARQFLGLEEPAE